MASIKEIAEKAKVSQATVSRVLNYDDTLSIADEKRKKILEIAEKLDYKPPRQRKKAMVSKRRNMLRIGLYHWYTQAEEMQDVYYLSIRLGIEKGCTTQNVELVKVFRDQYHEINHRFQDVDGIIAVGKFSNEEIDKLQMISSNILFVDSSPLESQCDAVVIDIEKATKKVLDYMTEEKEIEKIGYIGGLDCIGHDRKPIADLREKTLRTYLQTKEMLYEEHIHVGSFTAESGYQIIKKAAKNPMPKAYFVASDTIAIGVLRGLDELGIQVPQDLSIIGFNDIPNAKFMTPPLTTVKVYTEFMGETAVLELINRIQGRTISKKIVIPTTFIKRVSG